MQEIFVQRYIDAMYEYFDYNGDREGKTIRNYIASEYAKILKEVFGFSQEKILDMNQELYKNTYHYGVNYRKLGKWLKEKIGFVPIDDPDGIIFYYKAMHDYDMGMTDADDYAWLNTLFRYDIGAGRALEIIRWCYENHDTTVQDMVTINYKETLKNICELELGMNLDFSHWPKREPDCLEYGFKTDSFRDMEENKE